jgi:hypothetical protein
MEIKDRYEELKNKYNLPNLEELDNEFDLGNIEDNMLLRGIRKKIGEKIDFYSHLIDGFIQPDSTFLSLYEADIFNEVDRENLMALFKKIMILQRELVKLNLNLGEGVDAKFIKGFFEEWKQLKKDILFFIEKAQSSWCTEDLKNFNKDYFG